MLMTNNKITALKVTITLALITIALMVGYHFVQKLEVGFTCLGIIGYAGTIMYYIEEFEQDF